MPQSIWDQILFRARSRPNALAVFGAAGPVSFQALIRDVDGLSGELAERGLGGSDMVGIELGLSYLHLLVILALDRLGVASSSLRPATERPTPALLRQLAVTAVVSAEPAPADAPCAWITM